MVYISHKLGEVLDLSDRITVLARGEILAALAANAGIALAKFVAQLGADEVQFDYVRFPAEGDQKDASFGFQTEHADWQRSQVIARRS